MAIETLSVPEEHLPDVIRVIRAGLRATKTLPRGVRTALTNWCNEEDAYLKRLQEEP